MLNEKQLGSILGKTLPPLTIKDIHWKTQESDLHSVLFYKIGNEEIDLRHFEKRINQSVFNWLIVNKSVPGLPGNSSVVPEERWPDIQKKILDILYPIPNLKMMALTGTNGKTTTTDLILQIGHFMGKNGMSVGTLGVREYGKTILDFGLTSASFIDLRKFLNKYGKDKDFCVLEASSHALIQDRLYQIQFDSAGWLSFSQDHLDYHRSMDSYFEAKCLLIKQITPPGKMFVPNEQHDLFKKLSTISPKVSKTTLSEMKLPLFLNTKFNRNNLEVAVSIFEDVFKQKVSIDYNELKAPDGRFYIRSFKANFIVVDFAHTPDALENICVGIKESFPGYKLKVLFGCGGDRDRSKRPLMGRVADKYADYIYLTSDNPRSEVPEQILNDIVGGIKKTLYTIEVDRFRATQKAFSELQEREVLLLAGKGHEDYILTNGVKQHYSDIEQVEKFIKD